MPTIAVTYPRREGATFDTDYYRDKHTPLVKRIWGATGMSEAEILWPAGDDQPFMAMVLLRFPDDASIDASLGSAGTAEVMGDITKFTNIEPTIYRTL